MIKLFSAVAAGLIWSAVGSEKLSAAEAENEEAEDSSAGLPSDYAAHFLVAESTRSPDKKFAIIYPTLDFSEAKEAKDYLVAVEPFSLLGALPTKWPYFQSKSHGGIRAEWSDDNAVALITLDSKWGPGDIFLVELANDKLSRTTNLLEKLRQLLWPEYRSAKPKALPYNDQTDFIFEEGEDAVCKLEGANLVKIDATATTDPKGVSSKRWSARVRAVWDIRQGKFASHKITKSRGGAKDAD